MLYGGLVQVLFQGGGGGGGGRGELLGSGVID